MQEKFAGKDVLFFAVTYNEASRIKNFLQKVPFNFAHVTDSQTIIDQLGVTFFPTNILIDKNGEVIFFSEFDAFIGGKELQNITKLINKNLK
jgi:protein-disulfide isomerase-like protein with CxxC motif